MRQSHIRIKLTCLVRTARGNVRSTRASIVQSHEQARRGHGSSLEQRVASYVARRLRPRCCHLGSIDVKTFLRFLFWSSFYVFNVFFIFQTFFIFKKNVGKVRAASRLTRSTFKITATKSNGFINNRILYPVIRM